MVNWIKAWGFEYGRLDPGGDIPTGEKVRLHAKISDAETSSGDLTVEIGYKAPSGDWVMSPAVYKASLNYWYVDWMIPGGAEAGLYDTRMVASDPDGGSASSEEYGEFEVVS